MQNVAKCSPFLFRVIVLGIFSLLDRLDPLMFGTITLSLIVPQLLHNVAKWSIQTIPRDIGTPSHSPSLSVQALDAAMVCPKYAGVCSAPIVHSRSYRLFQFDH